MPILEIRKLWLEEVKYLAQNYTKFINPTLSRIATLTRYLEYEGKKLGQAGKLRKNLFQATLTSLKIKRCRESKKPLHLSSHPSPHTYLTYIRLSPRQL